jgi:hypothetical protein
MEDVVGLKGLLNKSKEKRELSLENKKQLPRSNKLT